MLYGKLNDPNVSNIYQHLYCSIKHTLQLPHKWSIFLDLISELYTSDLLSNISLRDLRHEISDQKYRIQFDGQITTTVIPLDDHNNILLCSYQQKLTCNLCMIYAQYVINLHLTCMDRLRYVTLCRYMAMFSQTICTRSPKTTYFYLPYESTFISALVVILLHI